MSLTSDEISATNVLILWILWAGNVCALNGDEANLIAAPDPAGRNFIGGGRAGGGGGGGLYTGPYFDPFSATNISVQVGSTALLPCRVRQASNRSVSQGRVPRIDRFNPLAVLTNQSKQRADNLIRFVWWIRMINAAWGTRRNWNVQYLGIESDRIRRILTAQ